MLGAGIEDAAEGDQERGQAGGAGGCEAVWGFGWGEAGRDGWGEVETEAGGEERLGGRSKLKSRRGVVAGGEQ